MNDAILEYLSGNYPEIIIASLITLAVSIFFFQLGLSIRKPKLKITGMSGGGSPQQKYTYHSVRVRNVPSFFWTKVVRDTPKSMHAHIFESKTKRVLGILHWENTKNRNILEQRASIPVGEFQSLSVFIRDVEGACFYIAAVKSEGKGLQKVPGTKSYSSEREEFYIECRDRIERKFRIDLIVTQFNNQFKVEPKRTISDKMSELVDLLRDMKGIFKRQ